MTPTNRFETLLDRMVSDVDRVFGGTVAPLAWTALPLALWSDAENLHIEAEVPGVPAEAIEATVHEDKLYLRYHRQPEEGRTYLHNSRTYGKVERVVALPEPVDAGRIQATLEHGVLRLTLPKSAEALPRKITIQSA
jgi:HSP20 family protein